MLDTETGELVEKISRTRKRRTQGSGRLRIGHGSALGGSDALCRWESSGQSHIGMIPSERSSGGRRQRFGKVSKQGKTLVRYLWGEATEDRRARKLGIRRIMLRDRIDYKKFGGRKAVMPVRYAWPINGPALE